MEALGKITTALLITATVAGVVIAVRSVPDIRRYVKIRRM